MHERTRLFVCRAGFVLACLLPTLLMAGAIGYFRSDAYLTARREEWVSTLSQRLGMHVEIDRLHYPDLSTAVLTGVRLLDAESNMLIAKSHAVEVMRLDDGTWRVEFDYPEFVADHLPGLQQRLHDRLLAELPSRFSEVHCRAKSAVLLGKTRATLQEIDAFVFPSDVGTGPEVALYFGMAGVETDERTSIKIQRNRTKGVVATHWECDTHATPLPCDVLAMFVPRLRSLGTKATLQGVASGTFARHDDRMQFAGTLRSVELDALSSGRAPRQPKLGKSREKWLVSGTANIDIGQLVLVDGRVTACEARLSATEHGTLGSELVAAAVNCFGLEGPTDTAAQYHYNALAFDFSLSDKGVRVIGRAGDAENGVIARSARGPILSESEARWFHQIALVQFLAPSSERSIPANPEATELWRHLAPRPRMGDATPRALQSTRLDGEKSR